VSISALQWLCNADKSSHNPVRRLRLFFQTLYNCLTRNARAVFQFYPENSEQLNLITSTAMRCGFNGGILVDFPNSTKARKVFLVIYTGQPPKKQMRARTGDSDDDSDDDVDMLSSSSSSSSSKKKRPTSAMFESQRGEAPSERNARRRRAKGRAPIKGRDWVIAKKERRRRQGRPVKADSKYTARKRPSAF
jgi:18S rRNA (guanine1575-N7)-methyltransferase